MGKQTIIGSVKEWLAGICWHLFLWLNNLTENEYFRQIKEQELRMDESSQLEPLVSLPCPFCANTKIRTWQTEDEYWHIQCNSDVCGACMDDFTTEQEAIKQWNVRSN